MREKRKNINSILLFATKKIATQKVEAVFPRSGEMKAFYSLLVSLPN